MNPIDKFFLWFFMLPAGLYQKLGAEPQQVKAILRAKLTMDNRRQAAFKIQNKKQEKGEVKQATLATMLGALFIGFFMFLGSMLAVDLISRLTIFTTMFIFMLCMTLISDFTSVLIDVRDNYIVLPKPISDATFVLSRLLHITIRTCMIVIPMTLPIFIALIVNHGIFVVLPFMLMVLMSTLLSVFLINALYILILKLTTPSKFQSIISYIQIAFTIFIFAFYQMMPKMMDSSMLAKKSLQDVAGIDWYPPYWFSDACLALTQMHFRAGSIQSLVLSVLVPLASVWIVVRFFAPSFNRKLSMITARTEESGQKAEKKKPKPRFIRMEQVAGWLTQSGTEYMGFLFSSKMMGRSRDFKMKVYPSFGMILVIVFMVFFRSFGGKIPDGKGLLVGLLMIVYLSSLVLFAALSQLPYSDKFKASWLFYSAPVESPGKVISGAVKAAMFLLYLPVGLLLLIFGLTVFGPSLLPNLLLGILNVLAIGAIYAYLMVKKLPFSSAMDGVSNGSSMIRNLIPIFGMGVIGLLQWLISGYLWAVLLGLVLSPALTWLVFQEIKRLDWNKIS